MRWDAELPLMPVQQLLDDAVTRWPERAAIEFMGQVISYSELGALVDRPAKGLQALGVKPGVHVGLYLPNTPHYPIAFFAVLKAGGTVVNYSPLDAERVLAHKIEDSHTDVLVTLDLVSLYPQLGRLLGTSRLQKLVVGSVSDFGAAREQVRAHLQGAGQIAPVPADARHVLFPGLLENDGRYQTYPLGDLTEAIAVLQYTGGTTGLPKGAMITHANLTAANGQYWESTQGEPRILEEGVERVLVVLPLFHIYALSVGLLLGVRLGAALVLHTKFDVDAVIKGYWNNSKATAESMTLDGYFRSGDVAKMDADGFFYIVDRTKDMLLCSGYNVYPRVIEEAIYEHPGVAEVCVIGIPDDYRGQSPKAFVTLKPGAPTLTLDELKAFLKSRLGKHEMIGALEIRAELPKTAVGKLSMKDLAEDEARKRAG